VWQKRDLVVHMGSSRQTTRHTGEREGTDRTNTIGRPIQSVSLLGIKVVKISRNDNSVARDIVMFCKSDKSVGVLSNAMSSHVWELACNDYNDIS
jgi:hypothetical protein